jgi:hypothetical protein
MKLFNSKINASVRKSLCAAVIGASFLASGTAMAGKPVDATGGSGTDHFRLSYQCTELFELMSLKSAPIPDGKLFIVEYVMGSVFTPYNSGSPIGNAWIYFDGVGDWISNMNGIPSKPGLWDNEALFSEKVHFALDTTPIVNLRHKGDTPNTGMCQVTLHGYLEDLPQ